MRAIAPDVNVTLPLPLGAAVSQAAAAASACMRTDTARTGAGATTGVTGSQSGAYVVFAAAPALLVACRAGAAQEFTVHTCCSRLCP